MIALKWCCDVPHVVPYFCSWEQHVEEHFEDFGKLTQNSMGTPWELFENLMGTT
jgi:hypothetical protein